MAALRTDFSAPRRLVSGRRSFRAEHGTRDCRDCQPDAVADNREHAQTENNKEDFHRSSTDLQKEGPSRLRSRETGSDYRAEFGAARFTRIMSAFHPEGMAGYDV